ncbi:MAG: hypothetical protein AB7P34_17195 [Vicinamibacterales bacterium]
MPRPETTILVVDDRADLADATELVLVAAGFRVVKGPSAAEALGLTRLHRPAPRLSDVNLPDESGVKAAALTVGLQLVGDQARQLPSRFEKGPGPAARFSGSFIPAESSRLAPASTP